MKIFVIGASGHGKVVADILLSGPSGDFQGFLDDDPQRAGTSVLGYPVQGMDAGMRDILSGSEIQVLIAIGDNGKREKLAADFDRSGVSFGTAIHPAACIGRDVKIREGTVVMAGAVVNSGSRIGQHVIINTGAIVDHDCRVGNFAHLSPAAALAGGVVVEAGAHVGTGAALLPQVRVGRGAVIGAGSVVINDVPAGTTWAGVPAQELGGSSHGRR